jgi:AraC-like DNA-binding protein
MAKTVESITKPIAPDGWSWAALPPPANPFRGACPEGVETPRNVLLFTHEDAERLQLGARDSYQHGRFVLILNAGGAGRVAVDGRWLDFGPGDGLLVFPYQVHHYAGLPADGRLRWLFLTFEQNDPTWLSPLRDRVWRAPAAAWPLARAAREAWRAQGEQVRALPLLAGLLLETLRTAKPRRAPGRPATASSPAKPDRAGPLLSRVHAWVHRPSAGSPRIKDLARALGLSEPRLRARFRREVGQSLGCYLRDVRLARAASLLVGTTLSVSEVALRCGYDSPYSFSRAFRAGTGRSPRAYRQAPGSG